MSSIPNHPIGTSATSIFRWRIRELGDQVILEPKSPAGIIAAYVAGGSVVLVGGFVFAATQTEIQNIFKESFAWAFVGGTAFLTAFPCFILWYDYREALRLVFDRLSDTITLPNLRQTWPRSQVRGWQVVHRTDSQNCSQDRANYHAGQ